MDKTVRLSMLLDIYGKLLTERQYDIADLYYNQNLSLSEIADELKITRQAVRKSLIEATVNVISYVIEEKLNFLSKKVKRDELLEEALKSELDSKAKKIIEKLKQL